MTKKQEQQFNKMLATLKTISKDYCSPERIKRIADKDYGLGYLEALEMAYENIQNDAKHCAKGVRPIK